MEAGLQFILFAGEVDLLQRGETRTVTEDHILFARLRRERDEDAPSLECVELPAAQSGVGLFQRLQVLVEDGNQCSGARVLNEVAQSAFANERAAALSSADEFHDPHASFSLQ